MDRRPPVYDDDGTVVYRASKLGLCQRALAAARLGMPGVPPSDKALADMEAGTAYESVVLAKLAAMGYEVTDQQAEVEHETTAGPVIRAHLDGVAIRLGSEGADAQVLEVKSLAPSTFRTWRCRGFRGFPAWAWQVSAGMHATGLPGLMAVADRQSGALAIMAIEVAPRSLDEIEERVAAVEVLAVAGDDGECPEAFGCPWFYLHDAPVFTSLATPLHMRGILRLAQERGSGGLRGRVERRLAEAGELIA